MMENAILNGVKKLRVHETGSWVWRNQELGAASPSRICILAKYYLLVRKNVHNKELYFWSFCFQKIHIISKESIHTVTSCLQFLVRFFLFCF